MEVTDDLSGTYFGSGTNGESTGGVDNIKLRINIFKALTYSSSRIRWALNMDFIKVAFSGNNHSTYMLTDEGYEYWKNEELRTL